MADIKTPVTVLGLGAMGRALATALLQGGHPTTVWNRTPGRDTELVAAGARGAASLTGAVRDGDLVIAVLLDHASVHAALDPIVGELSGKTVVNLTTTTPEEARELARWAAGHGIVYLDGAIIASPEMIGLPVSSLLYSGTREVFDDHRAVLELFGTAEYFGDDAGTASLYDFALLSGMYVTFAGFYHGAAMLRSAGVSAESFATRAVSWLTAITGSLSDAGRIIDSGDYTTDVQSLDFNKAALDAIVRASREAGVGLDVIGPVKSLIDRQVADGHGKEAFVRIFEGLVS
ncbi:NAD(P)-dependent oxidoreductase [Nocardia mexicana]|uniref:3-hydroxyisobutyrate dehydrogenase-like beta-hydroxyacid dehydrogenase n=1 Tax=Nocardia mexicana TaxID=279262 RepID=A0A370HED6_9NOCA|nr:NAD(P)-binding domain-containing protein [Nocardia mexicana]RDI55395.1 3-hydroxyisobutyrate dehydrogenase-like beta-hydroxyacid dehydrogenase [Nocardia mexicana]